MRTNDNMITVPDFIIVLRQLKRGTQTASELYRETNITKCHVARMKPVFQRKGWVAVTYEGSKHYLTLTEKGLKVTDAGIRLLNSLGLSQDKDIQDLILKDKKKKVKSDKEQISDYFGGNKDADNN